MGMRVSNLEKSVEFYLKALAPIKYEYIYTHSPSPPKRFTNGVSSYKKLMAFEGVQAIGAGGMPDIWLSQAKPDEERKPVKDLHFAFTAANREQVDAFHAAALFVLPFPSPLPWHWWWW